MPHSAERRGDAGLPPLPRVGAAPGEVRAALWPEYRAEFDESYRAALREAERTLDLAVVLDAVEYWRRRAWSTRDRVEHRRVVREAFRLQHGGPPPEDEPVSVTELRI